MASAPSSSAIGVGAGGGLLRVASNAQLDQDREREQAADRPPPELLTNLAAHVRQAFQAAVDYRQKVGVTERLLQSQRQRMGVYDPERLQEIKRQGGSRTRLASAPSG